MAVAMGDIDLVRPLGVAGIRCAVFAPPTESAHWSRHARAHVPWADPWTAPERAVENLLAFAAGQPEPPVLVPQSDGNLLLVSRHRDRLAGRFRFLLADADLIETACRSERPLVKARHG